MGNKISMEYFKKDYIPSKIRTSAVLQKVSQNKSSPNMREASNVAISKQRNLKSLSTVNIINIDTHKISDLINFRLDGGIDHTRDRSDYEAPDERDPPSDYEQERNPKKSTPENSLEELEVNDENKVNIQKALSYFSKKGATHKDNSLKVSSNDRNLKSDNGLIKVDQKFIDKHIKPDEVKTSTTSKSSTNLKFLKYVSGKFNKYVSSRDFNFNTSIENKPIGIVSNERESYPIKIQNRPTIVNNGPYHTAYHYDLSKFDLLKVIGKGTFGKVILARSKLDREKYYAIKCLKKTEILQGNGLRNLKTEKSILCMVDHPFIIRLNFTFQNNDKIFMCFDYHNGGELFYHLSRERRLKENLVKFYASEIYIALVYLHSKGIMYRDLKPENIILDRTGHIKIIDFGLSRMNIKEGVHCSEFCGTNEYLRKGI